MSAAVAKVVPSSAAPALSLLDETEPALRAHALRSLNTLADAFWPEISGAVEKIQQLSQDRAFPERDLASIVAAKVNFHLGSLESALRYALAAGSLFNVDEQTQFATTLRALCIDEYIALKSNSAKTEDAAFASELEAVVERVLDGCLANGEIREAIGVALESHRLDKVQQAIIDGCKSDDDRKEALSYCFECAQTLVTSRGYRSKVLSLISGIHLEHFTVENRDHVAVANCMAFVGDAKGTAEVLLSLVREAANASSQEKKDELELTALQIAFDIVDNDAPFFASEITELLPNPRPTAIIEPPASPSGAVPMDSDGTAQNAPEPVTPRSRVSTVEMPPEDALIEKLREVLTGSVTAALSLDFLCSHNRSDVPTLQKIKQGLDGRSSVCHSALVFANAIAHSGTAIDTFLRDNLDWLARASAWAKFSATSCLGVIHARHISSALNLLSPYLPQAGGLRSSSSASASAYSEGGALYALGLISATGGRDVSLPPGPGASSSQPITAKEYLFQALGAQGAGDVVKHGAGLGLGLSAMASWNGGDDENKYYEELKQILYTDSAVASEAAALGMGLIALGSGSERICDEMLAYARETEHEKIIRGLAVGIALVCYARQDDADPIIEKLNTDKEPILRYGAMYAVALAYCGTADNQAIKMLLHAAVTDVSDDVRRAAVIALGFVLLRHPKQLLRIVSLLSESCHAHVRYGAAIAIGVACMGSGSTVAVEILEKLSIDNTDFVRQGALIGMAMVLMHHTEDRTPKAVEFRKLLEITRGAKLEEVVARFGAVVASGLIDAGGRNGKISFTSANGHPRMTAIVGMAMFTQFWYWYPLVHFIGLSIQPASLIAVNKDLKMPMLNVLSNAPAVLFDYVPGGPVEKQKELTRAPAAVLSVTAKSKAREARKAAAKRKAETGDEKMTDGKENGKTKKTGKNGNTTEDKDKKNDAKFSVLKNPCRVVPGQEYAIEWDIPAEALAAASEGSDETALEKRYEPVMKDRKSGIVLLRDTKKGTPEDFVEMQSLAVAAPPAAVETPTSRAMNEDDEVTTDEPNPPEPFVYNDEDEKSGGGGDSSGKDDSNMMDSVE